MRRGSVVTDPVHRRTVRFLPALLLALMLAGAIGEAGAATAPGTTITNLARADYRIGGEDRRRSSRISFVTTNAPPTRIELSATRLSSGVRGAEVGALSVTDRDLGDRHVLVVDDPRFEIIDGVLRLREGVSIDAALHPGIDLDVTATDLVGASYTETFRLEVTGNLRAQGTPCSAADARGSVPIGVSYSICENVPGASLAQFPVAEGARSYQVSDPRFTFTRDGLLRLKDGVHLDYEAESRVPLVVTVEEGGSTLETLDLGVLVRDRNEPPSIAVDGDLRVREGETGVELATLTVSDPDQGDSHVLKIDDPRFEVVEGILRLKPDASVTGVDWVDLGVIVTDAGGLSAERSLHIEVLRINRPPAGEPLETGVAAGSPSGTVIDRVLATDPDPDDVLRWSLVAGNDGGTFTIDPENGTLRVAQVAAPGEDGRVFELVVRVRDDNGGGDPAGILSTDVPVRVTVTADNSRPRIDDGSFPAVREDAPSGTRIGSVAATDPDGPLSYRILGGDPAGRFRIDAATGELFLTGVGLDFETNQSHRLEVAVTDSGVVPLTSLATFEIPVIDANEAPLVPSAIFDLAANAPLGTLVGEIRASDPDHIAGDRVRLEIVSGNERGAFEIDPRTGTIKVVNLARLGAVPGGVVELVVRGTDENAPADPAGRLSTDGQVKIRLLAGNGPPTAIGLDNLEVTAGDEGAVIGNLDVTDPDPQDDHRFALSDPRFVVENGVLRLRDGESLAAGEVVRLAITATDPLGQSVTRVFPIHVGELARNPAEISFLRAPAAVNLASSRAPLADASFSILDVGQGQCSTTASMSGPFVDSPPPRSLGDQPLAVPGQLALMPVELYKVGEPLFVQLVDRDANRDPGLRETVVITLDVDSSRDTEILRLTETAPDSATFVGYIRSTNQPSSDHDCVLWVANAVTIVASYYDAEDGTDTAAAAALVDPLGLVFDSGSGRRIDGVEVRLVDADTGEDAEVFGDDPFAPYPAQVTSGDEALDEAGILYDFAAGGYRFPFVQPGRYRLEVTPPNRFRFPSDATDAEIAALPGGPYVIRTGSRGGTFEVPVGPAVRLDLPLDLEPLVPTPSSVRLFTLAGAGGGEPVRIGRTRCEGATGLERLDLPRDGGGALIELPATLSLQETRTFAGGDFFYMEVTDADEDRDPFAADRIRIEFTVEETGDREALELVETGHSTGVFTGYLGSGPDARAAGNCALGTGPDTDVVAGYVDADDRDDVSRAELVVDPSALVFDSRTGAPLDGARVTLVDAVSGEPAEVFGADGAASYPSTVVTGEAVTDGAGNLVDPGEGRFRFPVIPPGEYRYQVEPPADHVWPSRVEDADLQDLDGAPFRLDAGSRGEAFTVTATGLNLRDVPLDPVSAELFLTKSALEDVVAVGDFLPYEVTVQNAGAGDAGAVTLHDTLPHGFRYQDGSARVDGERIEASVAEDGRSLDLELPALSLGESLRVRYVVEVAAGARQGSAVNRVTGSGPAVRSSNTAEASVVVREDLLRSKAILVGRVFEGDCETPKAERRGLSGVRLYMEDGTNVITDSSGRWHIEGVEPGGHVVQMDVTSLPASHRVIPCDEDSRSAGSPFSRFVDVQGGSLWRADFHVALKPPVEEDVLTRLQARVEGGRVHFDLEAEGREVPLTGLMLITMLPDGLEFVSGSARRNGEPVDDPAGAGGSAVTFRLGDTEGAWTEHLTFSARVTDALALDTHEVRTIAMFGTPTERRVRSGLATVELDAREATLDTHPPAEEVPDSNLDTHANEPASTNLDTHANELARRVLDTQATSDADAEMGVQAPAVRVGVQEAVQEAGVGVQDGTAEQAGRSVVLTRADSGPVRTRATGEIPGQGEESGYQRRKVPDQQPPEFDAESVGEAGAPPAILYPARDFLPRITSTWFVVRHGLEDKVALRLNDELVSPFNFDGRTKFREKGLAISTWRGVDIRKGRNTFSATITQADGAVRTLVREVYFSGGAVRGEVVPELSRLPADGATVPEVAIRFYDHSGSPVRPGMTGEYTVEPPYAPYDAEREEVDVSLEDHRDRNTWVVTEDGVAWLPLEPTSRAGEVRIGVDFGERGREEFRARLQPVARDWIVVGFGEGSAAYETLSENMVTAEDAGHDEGLAVDGRVALFAKGMIRGKWLMTLAYDSDKNRQRRVGNQIDPDRFYSLYGDGAQQQYDAESQENLYLKIERSAFSALFGDYDTILGAGELTRFSRRLTGVRTEYVGEDWELVAFGAETENAFVRDEIRGDGTSGLYRLSGERIFENSERITIETRDRFHDDEVIESRSLARHTEYAIDYDAGTILFKSPVPSQDENLNPVYIVAEYETDGRGDGRRDLIVGGRLARVFDEAGAEVGLTMIHDGTRGAEADLGGLDTEWDIDERTEVRAEAAWSRGKGGDEDAATREGLAWQVEAERRGEIVDTRAYYKEQQADFGVGQQSASLGGTRRFGVTSEAQIGERVRVDSEAWQQSQLESGAVQNVFEAEGRWRIRESTEVGLGGRAVREEDAGGENTATNQATASLRQALFGNRVRLDGGYEQALGGTDSRDFPTRALIGAEVDVLPALTLIGTQEFTFADDRDTQDTHVGARSKPWSGAALDAGVTERIGENRDRLFANVGLSQSLQLSEYWKFDFGVDREQTLGSNAAVPGGQAVPDDRDADLADGDRLVRDPAGLNPATPPASGAAADSDFTSGFLGAAYKRETWQATGRVEVRHADDQDRMNVRAGFARQLDEGRIISLTLDYLTSDGPAEETVDGSARFALAWRPQSGDWTFLDRLDLVFDERIGRDRDFDTRKLVNNFNANFRPDARNQLAFQFGTKYVLDDLDGQTFSGVTTLLGGEYRRDLARRWDLGVHGNVLSSWNTSSHDFRTGLSVGHTPIENVWVSIGYNFTGFVDEDFTAADYTARGPFVKFRFKVDQASLRQYLGDMPFSLD